MKFLRIGLVAAFTVIVAPVLANIMAPDDSAKLVAVQKKVVEFFGDLNERYGPIFRSVVIEGSPDIESRHALLCMVRIRDQLWQVQASLYAATAVTQMSYPLNDATDEQITLAVVKNTLKYAFGVLETARSEINSVMAACRRSQLIYDTAKTLMAIVQEAVAVVQPMFKRVEAVASWPKQ
jgi:hypothetical protein